MTKSRFDPIEDERYGTCDTCGLGIPTKTQAAEHTTATLEAARRAAKNPSDRVSSHTIRITNPPREDQIRSEVEDLVHNAVREVIEALDELVEDGQLSRVEATQAIARWDDFEEAWGDAGFATEDEPAPASTPEKENAA